LNFLATASGSRYNDGAYVSSRTNLAEMVVFNHKGPAASKNFVYILGRNNHYDSGKYVDLFGVDKDGKALTLKVKRSDWETDFDGKDNAYKKVWQYSTNADGVTSLTAIQENTISTHQVILGSVLRLTSGTVAFTAEGTCGAGNYHNIDTHLSKTTYDKSFALETETGHVWNVRNLETGSDASQGNISTNSPKHAIIILNEKDGNKIETAYVWDYTADEKVASLSMTLTPPRATIESGESITLTASGFGGSAPYTYAWSVDGAVITGQTNTTLTVNGADYTTGAHNFTVMVTDAAGDRVQKSVTVTVNASDEQTPASGLIVNVTGGTNVGVMRNGDVVTAIGATQTYLGFKEGDTVTVYAQGLNDGDWYSVGSMSAQVSGGVLTFTMPGENVTVALGTPKSEKDVVKALVEATIWKVYTNGNAVFTTAHEAYANKPDTNVGWNDDDPAVNGNGINFGVAHLINEALKAAGLDSWKTQHDYFGDQNSATIIAGEAGKDGLIWRYNQQISIRDTSKSEGDPDEWISTAPSFDVQFCYAAD
jgi:hypothetical protein